MSNEIIIKRKCGRPRVVDGFIDEKLIVETYRKNHSMRKTAQELNLALRTVFKYVQASSASYPIGSVMHEDPLEFSNNRKIAKRLDALGTPLPRSVGAIIKVLNGEFNYSAVQHFLSTRVKAVEEVLIRAGSLLDHTDVILRDIYGRNIQVGSIAQYQLTVDRYNLNITLEATLKFGGKITARMSFENYRKLLETPVKCPPNAT